MSNKNNTKLHLVKQEFPRFFTIEVTDSRLKEVGILENDELLIDTMQAVGNGHLVVIKANGCLVCGFALFLGDGKLSLTYYNTEFEPVTYELSEIQIIGRVLYSQKDWRKFNLQWSV